MAHVTRLGGAILAHSGESYFLVGDLKEPLDFAAAGFAAPGERDLRTTPYIRLAPLAAGGAPALPTAEPVLDLALEGEALARKLADCFVIRRNGSVSERLWRLVTESSARLAAEGGREVIDGRWLGATPEEVWEAVRDSVLRC